MLFRSPSSATLQAWTIERWVREGDLAVWLRGYGGQLDEDLRGQLGLLVGLRRGDLAVVAAEVLGEGAIAMSAEENVGDISSDDANRWVNRGNDLLKAGRYEEAIKSYDHATSIKPDDDKVWYIRGITLAILGRYEEAIKSHDHAISIKPEDRKSVV